MKDMGSITLAIGFAILLTATIQRRIKRNGASKGLFKDYEEQKAFNCWAFGSSAADYSIANMHAWNGRWGDILWLEPGDNVDTSLKRMVTIWKELGGGSEE